MNTRVVPCILDASSVQVVICITQTTKSIAECGFGRMTAESCSIDLIIDIIRLDEISIISFDNLSPPGLLPF